LEEHRFIAQLKSGNENAFKDLVKLFGDKVYNTSLSMLQNTDDAEDVTQEVFTTIFQSIHQFKGESLLSTWIYRIAISKSLEHIRKKNRKKRFALVQSLYGDEIVKNTSNSNNFYHPGVQLENKELSVILFKAINKLPENQKTAFILHKIEDLSYAEITEVMNVSLASVESLMFRAKQNLRKWLSNYYKELDK
jgi:RNA polymerase sigma factor (sigma-70 family)